MPCLPVIEIGLLGHMVVRTNSSGLSAARRQVHGIAQGCMFSEDEASDILLAVGEAISNAYRHGTQDHANGFIYVDWQFHEQTLTVSIKDEGASSPSGISHCLSSSYTKTGRGLDIIRKSMDDVHVEHGNGTRVVLRKRAARDNILLKS